MPLYSLPPSTKQNIAILRQHTEQYLSGAIDESLPQGELLLLLYRQGCTILSKINGLTRRLDVVERAQRIVLPPTGPSFSPLRNLEEYNQFILRIADEAFKNEVVSLELIKN